MGTSIHKQNEHFLQDNPFFDDVQTEVKLKFRNLSGTIDLVMTVDDVTYMGDFKTGKEDNIKKKIKDSTDWIIQLSVYRYLYFKQHDLLSSDKCYIYWLCVDTQKYGIHEIQLLSIEETAELIKDFMKIIDTPIEDEPKCDGCVYWRHRWCGVKSVCPHWSNPENVGVDEW